MAKSKQDTVQQSDPNDIMVKVRAELDRAEAQRMCERWKMRERFAMATSRYDVEVWNDL